MGLCAIHPAAACEVAAPLNAIDPPGFYDDAPGYADAVKPMRNFIAKLNKSADAGDWPCALDMLDGWAKADALMGPISGYQGYYERSWAGTDFAMVILRMPTGFKQAGIGRAATHSHFHIDRVPFAKLDAHFASHVGVRCGAAGERRTITYPVYGD